MLNVFKKAAVRSSINLYFYDLTTGCLSKSGHHSLKSQTNCLLFKSKNCFGLKFKMKICEVLTLILILKICSANEEGYLNVSCNQASDCYIFDDFNQGLQLWCLYDVNKCICLNSISSNFHLKWENNQCLMSKYGPCGGNGELVVGCQDGFVCVESQCRDPDKTKAVKVTPFVFQDSNCSNGCSFGDDLHLTCDRESHHCQCEKIEIADAPTSGWDIRNYDGDYDCSVGKFGPCGIKNGIKIDCHGGGISCVDGSCLDPNHLISGAGEDCEYTKNCKEGLLCSSKVCIEPFSLPESEHCEGDNECQEGLRCQSSERSSPWSLTFCTKN